MVRNCLLAPPPPGENLANKSLSARNVSCAHTQYIFKIHFALNLVAKMSLERISGSEQKFICQYADLKMR